MSTTVCSKIYIKVSAGLLALLLLMPATVTAQGGLPDVGVILIVEVRDVPRWVALHDQVLRTASQVANPLAVTVTGTSPRRSITVNEPRFTVSFVKGSRAFAVTITGKVAAAEAVAGLGGFNQAVVESPAECELELFYGLSSVLAYVVEMHLTRE